MNKKFLESVFLITSSDLQLNTKKRFGTGFVIHQTEHTTYLLTCAHVVEAVGGPGKVKVGRHLAKVIEPFGDALGCDLAVLAVPGELANIPPLKLGVVGEKGKAFEAAGCYQDDTNTRKLADINGRLGGTQIIVDMEGDRTITWNLEISDDSEHDLKPGYSGSPVIDKTSGYVLGVVAQLISQGKGLAISIEALKKVWQEMPENLIYTEEAVNTPPIDKPRPYTEEAVNTPPIDKPRPYTEEAVNAPPIDKPRPYSDKPEKWLQDNINRISKDIDIEKENDEYLTDEIAGIQGQLRMVAYGLEKRSLERQLKGTEQKRDLCRQNLENLQKQEEEIFKEIEKRKKDNLTFNKSQK